MRFRPLPVHAALAALAAILAGCATPASASPARALLDKLTRLENLPGKPGCFWKSSFQGDWTVLNDSTLIVHAPMARDAYLIKLFESVPDLGFKESLAFEDRMGLGRICDDGNNFLLVPGWQLPIPIAAVHALGAGEQDELLRAAGRQVPHRHAAASPAPAGD